MFHASEMPIARFDLTTGRTCDRFPLAKSRGSSDQRDLAFLVGEFERPPDSGACPPRPRSLRERRSRRRNPPGSDRRLAAHRAWRRDTLRPRWRVRILDSPGRSEEAPRLLPGRGRLLRHEDLRTRKRVVRRPCERVRRSVTARRRHPRPGARRQPFPRLLGRLHPVVHRRRPHGHARRRVRPVPRAPEGVLQRAGGSHAGVPRVPDSRDGLRDRLQRGQRGLGVPRGLDHQALPTGTRHAGRRLAGLRLPPPDQPRVLGNAHALPVVVRAGAARTGAGP